MIDIKNAHVNGVPQRKNFVAPPRELGLGKMIAQQTKCVCGTRDAGMIWEETGFISGKPSPCFFYRPEWKLSLVVHGDDFTALRVDESIDKLEAGLYASFEIPAHGRIGEHLPLKEMRILNRIVTLTDNGIPYEAGP